MPMFDDFVQHFVRTRSFARYYSTCVTDLLIDDLKDGLGIEDRPLDDYLSRKKCFHYILEAFRHR